MFPFNRSEFETFQRSFICQLSCLYDIQSRQSEMLIELKKSAPSPALKEVFDKRLAESQQQLIRLEKIFGMLGQKPDRTIMEERNILYETANFGTARIWALHLGHDAIADMLKLCISSEREADNRLIDIAHRNVQETKLERVGAH